MESAAPRIARELFLMAAAGGPAEPPEAVRRRFDTLETHAAQSLPIDTFAIQSEVGEEFSTWDTFFSTQRPEPADADRWVRALRWVLQELHAWTPDVAHPWLRLQVLLAAMSAFDTENAGVDAVLQKLQGSQLPEGLCRLLEYAAGGKVRADAGGDRAREEIQSAAHVGDFEQLKLLTRHLELRLPGDARLAIYLLWRMRPDLLVSVVNQKREPVFSYAVREVLGEGALDFALSVDNLIYKFFSARDVADARPAHAPSGSVDLFRDLLLQIANTGAWGSWVRAFYTHPQGGTVSDEALSRALAQTQVTHWAGFVNAVQLWTHAGTTVPVANILVGFYQEVGDPAAREMWSLAFRRWDEWDYERADSDAHMFAPAACSFDFPVAMHYAHLPPAEVTAEEQRLARAIDSIELTWFSSESELITHRNRLLSRLRLVRHGQALASGATAEPLPQPIQPDSEYAALRYRYFDASSARSTRRI